ncbi:MAG TPA: PQQ-binding-like beta-propeller repeat protein [Tepidisphaeraceae bacterium]|nr:PQQ-binding-like beta-propeller repeat protein [Tepidisphaeraceae bacterium]
MRLVTPLLILAWTMTVSGAERAEWPQFLGPARDGKYAGDATALAATWPAGGPKVVWERKAGRGWSSPVVAGGRVFVFHREGDAEVLECLEAGTGKAVWRAEHPTAYQDKFDFDDGPRATPAVSGGRVFTLGAAGVLACHDAATGKEVWAVDTRKAFQSDEGYFGMACSPLVEGKAVIVNVGGKAGGKGAGVVAFDTATGKLLWQATEHEAGYSSPVAATVAGKRRVLSLTRDGLVSLAPESGEVDWAYKFRARTNASVNAASPVVSGDRIFLTASYGVGAALLTWGEARPTVVWEGDEALSAHYATPVLFGGHLYGVHGRQETGCELRCAEWATGKVKWAKDGFGAATVMLAGDAVLALTEGGELVRVSATGEGYKETARATVLGGGVRAGGALADGLYFARDGKRVVCVDLRK